MTAQPTEQERYWVTTRRCANVQVTFGANIGVVSSFFEVLRNAPDADYFSFCDQDDFWRPDKIERAVRAIESTGETSKPILYSCNKFVCDESLNILHRSSLQRKHPSFGNSLIQNIITGNTVVFNKALYQKIKIPLYCMMHDSWLYQVATCFGEVILDDECYVYYRQHGRNVVGTQRGINRLKKSVSRIIGGNILDYRLQAVQFEELYGDEMCARRRSELDLFLESKDSFAKALRFMMSRSVRRQNVLEDIVFKLVFLLSNDGSDS